MTKLKALEPEVIRKRRELLDERKHEAGSQFAAELRTVRYELQALQEKCTHPQSPIIDRPQGLRVHQCGDCGKVMWYVESGSDQ